MPLDPDQLDPDPVRQLAAWLDDARGIGIELPEAFALATADTEAAPSVRMVLLRGLDADGIRFYTNRESRKGRDLAVNARAAAAFWWPTLHRQARVAGGVRPLDDEEATAYWSARPPGSRLSAWASDQGREIASRSALESRVTEVRRRFGDGEVPLPPFWGGYLLAAENVEFWESREDRLHDRVEYTRDARTGVWRRRRLQP